MITMTITDNNKYFFHTQLSYHIGTSVHLQCINNTVGGGELFDFIIYILRFSHSFPHEKFRLENCDSQSQQRNGFLTRA